MKQALPSIRFDENRCRGRMACLHICPTQAIRVRDRKARLLRDLCMDCGECVRVCPSGAIRPQTGSFADLSRFRHTIAIPSPVIYSQFGKGVPPSAILVALRGIGFNDAWDVACASESVSIAIEEYLKTVPAPRPLISPFCPAIVRLIQIRYPNLLEHLIPIESPMEIAAREAKRRAMKEHGLKESEIGAVYITPCPSKSLAITNPLRKRHSFLNGTIAISDIYTSLLRALPSQAQNGEAEEIRGLGLGWPIVGGQVACLKAEECLAIGGLEGAMRIFEEIENGKLRDIEYIEVHSCPTGCVGGSLTVENPYIARGHTLRTVRTFGGKPCQDPEKIKDLYRRNFFSLPGTIAPVPLRPLDEDVSRALQKLHRKKEVLEGLPQIDCGACGSPTCAVFAEDVVRGEAREDECPFVAMLEFEHLSTGLLEKIRPHSRRLSFPRTEEHP
ncbi:MAG: [Fe-Fe] hydrogenase large subunit C-terminal domain-containing protein [Bacteroidota bacterium]